MQDRIIGKIEENQVNKPKTSKRPVPVGAGKWAVSWFVDEVKREGVVEALDEVFTTENLSDVPLPRTD
jgi:hypothetical protein